MDKNYGTYLYHPKEAPAGRIFYDGPEGMDELEAKGWVDSPAKFRDSKPKGKSKPDTESTPATKPDAPKTESETEALDDASGQTDADAAGADDVTEPETKLPPKAEMLKALKDAGVDIDGRSGEEKIEAAYRELIAEGE